MVWAGADDPAQFFAINSDEAQHVQALRRLVLGLWAEFEDESFLARDVIGVIEKCGFNQRDDPREQIADALADLQCRDVRNSRSVGRALNSVVDRPVPLDGCAFVIRVRIDRNGVSAYQLHQCGV